MITASAFDMTVLEVRTAKKTHPTGDPKFSVQQAFPSGFTAEDSDPFLMCDFFGPSQPVHMADFEVELLASVTHSIPADHDNCLLYMYKGSGTVCGTMVATNQVVRLDASDISRRSITVVAGEAAACFMLFSGRMLHEPIAWHGPFVMNTNEEIQRTLAEYRRGTFLRKRAPWNYKVLSSKPADYISSQL
ncbi:unnamed protein product [Sphagnum balticum]